MCVNSAISQQHFSQLYALNVCMWLTIAMTQPTMLAGIICTCAKLSHTGSRMSVRSYYDELCRDDICGERVGGCLLSGNGSSIEQGSIMAAVQCACSVNCARG